PTSTCRASVRASLSRPSSTPCDRTCVHLTSWPSRPPEKRFSRYVSQCASSRPATLFAILGTREQADARVIEAHHLTKDYRTGTHALKDVSFGVEKGEFVFLTGPSGAGKSTLLRLLLRADIPSSGDLVVNGRNLARLNPTQVQAYRRSVGFVFQDFKLIPRKTVFDNIVLVPRLMGVPEHQLRRRATQALTEVGLAERLNALPLELSGGEQQRVAVARALVSEPLLFLA